jgi:cytoskeletal protein RodZ
MNSYLEPALRGSSQPSPTLHLSRKRQAKGIDIRAIADSTHISLPYLEAIEAENFEELPRGVYAVSYIRQYAAAIGIDEDAIIARYRSLIEMETASQVGPYLQFSKATRPSAFQAFLQHLHAFVHHS